MKNVTANILKILKRYKLHKIDAVLDYGAGNFKNSSGMTLSVKGPV